MYKLGVIYTRQLDYIVVVKEDHEIITGLKLLKNY